MTPRRRTVATWAAAVIAVAVIAPPVIDAGRAIRSAFADDVTASGAVFVIDHRCDPFTITDATDPADVVDMMSRGWAGDPTDHAEAIYPPGCVAG